MRIDAGALDCRLMIQTAVTVTDGVGQEISSFTDLRQIWGERLELRVVDTARAGTRDTYTTARFLVRYRADITTSNRVVSDGITYDVVAVDPQGRRESIILTLEEVRP